MSCATVQVQTYLHSLISALWCLFQMNEAGEHAAEDGPTLDPSLSEGEGACPQESEQAALTNTGNSEIASGQCSSLSSILSQRRRVNPESLALRLGPELVRDLEALILPGNIEMPSFAVRRELQERYNVDRRHIYDYFHSRGLRVLKEEKTGVVHSTLVKDTSVPSSLVCANPCAQSSTD